VAGEDVRDSERAGSSIVLLPGLDGTGELFEPFVARLPESWTAQVVRYPADRDMAYADYVDFVRARLPTGRSWVLLGESFSGPIAISLAAERPPGLRGLVLCNTFARHPWPPALAALPWTALLARPFWPIASRRLGVPVDDGRLRGLFRAAAGAAGTAVLARRVREVLRVDVTAALLEVDVPALYLRGTDDAVVPGRALERIRTVRPDTAVAEIVAPHLLLQVAPAEAWEAVSGFARQVAAG
jgi:pimeloyl-[acyl-carrier protein] methyl ester esterase